MAGCSTCVKISSLVVITVIAVVGCLLIWVGAAQTFQVQADSAAAEEVDQLLINFTVCSQITSSFGSPLDEVLQKQCSQLQAPYMALFALGGVFALFATTAAVFSAIKGGKVAAYYFSIFSSVTMALVLVGVFAMAQSTSPIASRFIDCSGYSAGSISTVEAAGFVCTEGSPDGRRSTTLKWLRSILLYYIGAAFSMFALASYLVLNTACRGDKKLQPPSSTSYTESFIQPPAPGQQQHTYQHSSEMRDPLLVY